MDKSMSCQCICDLVCLTPHMSSHVGTLVLAVLSPPKMLPVGLRLSRVVVDPRSPSKVKESRAHVTWQKKRTLFICWITALMTGFSCNVRLWCIMGVQAQRLLVLKPRVQRLSSLFLEINHFGVRESMLEV